MRQLLELKPEHMYPDKDQYVLTDRGILRLRHILYIDTESIEQQKVDIYAIDDWHTVTGFAALELVYCLKPSALEGKRLNWRKHAWAFHNLIGHPLMQLLAYLGFYELAMKVHDNTVPKPIDGPIKIS